MENASKALLIAGAILVCILIIGVGMLVFQSINGTVQEGVTQMSTQEKTLFNQQFEQYAGTSVNGSSVRALISKINSNNKANEDSGFKIIKDSSSDSGIFSTGAKGGSTGDISKINTAATYSVSFTDTDNDGLVDAVTINRK